MAITQTTPAHFFLMSTCTQRVYDRLRLPSQNTCWKFILTECNKGSDYLLTAKSPRNFFNILSLGILRESYWSKEITERQGVEGAETCNGFQRRRFLHTFIIPNFQMRIVSQKFLGMSILLTNFAHSPSNGLYQYGICAFQSFIFLQKKNFFNLFSSPIKGKSKDFISLQNRNMKINVIFA
jgi:hypothetical protein